MSQINQQGPRGGQTHQHRAAAGVAPSHQLWLFVEFLPDGPFFPVVIIQAGNQWTAEELYVGGPGQAGQQFALNLADLGPVAHERLEVYFKRERASGDNPVGFAETSWTNWM
jgi:hypothetical protein